MNSYTGWDVGGAHLKMVTINASGYVQCAGQWPTPLWQGMESLTNAINQAKVHFQGSIIQSNAITMTGELVDCFANRREGVEAIAQHVISQFNEQNTCFYAGPEGFLDLNNGMDKYLSIASSNWYATASYIATRFKQGILFDIGSTTSDIVPFSEGNVLTENYSDHERLIDNELCYTGVIRTPVMAVVDQVPWGDGWCPVMNESFARMADVYRITGELPAGVDLSDTCDGREKDVPGSIRRLARMIGMDVNGIYEKKAWLSMAVYISRQQQQALVTCLNNVMQQHGWLANINREFIIIGAGCGRFLIRKIANELQLPYVDFESVLDAGLEQKRIAADCATAVSVAQLMRLNR